MLCVRCSHPLSPRADRCLRCFALNPQNAVARVSAPLHQPTPAPPRFDLSSDPPARELSLSIGSDPPAQAMLDVASEPPRSGSFRIAPPAAPLVARAVPDTDPDPVAPATVPFAKPRNLSLPFDQIEAPGSRKSQTPGSVLQSPAVQAPVAIEAPVPQAEAKTGPEPAPPGALLRACATSRLLAWSIDFALLALLAFAQIFIAARFTSHGWLDLALSRPLFPFWIVLAACDAIACSWLFAAAGRTPGMFALRQRLRTLEGAVPTPAEALQRALLSLLSAAPALFGFSLALLDARGQTLHDKLCGCIVTID